MHREYTKCIKHISTTFRYLAEWKVKNHENKEILKVIDGVSDFDSRLYKISPIHSIHNPTIADYMIKSDKYHIQKHYE